MGNQRSSITAGSACMAAVVLIAACSADVTSPGTGGESAATASTAGSGSGSASGPCELHLDRAKEGCGSCPLAYKTSASDLAYCTESCTDSQTCPAGHRCADGACLLNCIGACPDGTSCELPGVAGCAPDSSAHRSVCEPHIEAKANACVAPCEFALPLGSSFYCTTALPCADPGTPMPCLAGWQCSYPLNEPARCEIICQIECPSPWVCRDNASTCVEPE